MLDVGVSARCMLRRSVVCCMQVGFQRQKMTLTDERVSKIDELLQALHRLAVLRCELGRYPTGVLPQWPSGRVCPWNVTQPPGGECCMRQCVPRRALRRTR
jgi:hypothetical protein